MILNFAVNINDYNEKISAFYGIWDFCCPCCNAFRSFSRHAFYTRNICILSSSQIIEKKLNILRLICNSCGTTHAILPADTIPYAIYSFSCVLQLLTNHFVRKQSILSLCEQFKVSFQLLYIFIKRFTEHFIPCINFLRIFSSSQLDFNSSFKDVLPFINTHFNSTYFQLEFLNHMKFIFLMTKSQNILSRHILIGLHFKPPT